MRFPNLQEEYELALDEQDREPDGLLHCSRHIWWPMRFTQLQMAGNPMQAPEFLDRITMLTGTLHHSFIEEWLKKQKDRWWELIASEVDLTEYLPEGWTGKADWVFYDKEADHCILGDLKTIKAEGIQWLTGIKEDHLAQLSCYDYGLRRAGYTMAPKLFVFYLPKNKIWTHEVKSQQLESVPLEGIEGAMNNIKYLVDGYVERGTGLARMPAPVYKYSWNKTMGVFDVRQHPDWKEVYTCPFDKKLCPRTPIKKIGHWTLNRKWVTRYPEFKTASRFPKPTEAEFVKRGG